MLVEFTVSNFCSILEAQTLKMVASKLKDDSEHQCFKPSDSAYLEKLSLLKTTAIYGANASGKSNLLKALDVMRRTVLSSAEMGQRGETLSVIPFKLNSVSVNAPSEFEVVFIAEGVRYQYGFSASKTHVTEEWLYSYPKGRPQRWFSRVWDASTEEHDWEFGTGMQGEKQLWKNATRNNALFLSTAVQLNSQQLKPIFDWFKEKFQMVGVNGWNEAYSAEYCLDGEQKGKILSFLKAADLGIEGIDIKSEQFDAKSVPENIPTELRDVILSEMKDKEIFEVNTLHTNELKEVVSFQLNEESTGTQKLFMIAGPWLDVLKNGLVLVVDELHDNLHPKLVKYLIELFHNKETNPKNAQLIFTTHETSILNQSIFRRDQIWFCEKDESQATQVFPLTDFNARKGSNLESAYLAGRFGAVPYVQSLG
ncbi:MAG: ATP-binding protein [Thiomicrorhabdus sp.]|nr:ATP-binding protein [Thiomicrorhabdus sp.]